MERFLHEAIVKYLNDGVLDTSVSKTSEKRENFKKACHSLKVEKGVLMYKGRRNEFLPVPTPEQVDNLLYKVHVKKWKEGESDFGKKHYRGVQLHIDALSGAGWVYPASLGGLKALAEE